MSSTNASKSPSHPTNNGQTLHATVAMDWTKAAQTALGSALFAGLLGGAFYVIGKVIESDMRVNRERRANAPTATTFTPFAYAEYEIDDDSEIGGEVPEGEEAEDRSTDGAPPPPVVDEKIAQAASLLGIATGATEDEIRSALRARLSSSRLHPDHGGDGEEAKRLIAAKNLLIERARAVRP